MKRVAEDLEVKPRKKGKRIDLEEITKALDYLLDTPEEFPASSEKGLAWEDKEAVRKVVEGEDFIDDRENPFEYHIPGFDYSTGKVELPESIISRIKKVLPSDITSEEWEEILPTLSETLFDPKYHTQKERDKVDLANLIALLELKKSSDGKQEKEIAALEEEKEQILKKMEEDRVKRFGVAHEEMGKLTRGERYDFFSMLNNYLADRNKKENINMQIFVPNPKFGRGDPDHDINDVIYDQADPTATFDEGEMFIIPVSFSMEPLLTRKQLKKIEEKKLGIPNHAITLFYNRNTRTLNVIDSSNIIRSSEKLEKMFDEAMDEMPDGNRALLDYILDNTDTFKFEYRGKKPQRPNGLPLHSCSTYSTWAALWLALNPLSYTELGIGVPPVLGNDLIGFNMFVRKCLKEGKIDFKGLTKKWNEYVGGHKIENKK